MAIFVFVSFIIIVFSSIVIVKALSSSSIVKSEKVKDRRACKCKTLARIISTDATGRIDRDTGRGIYTSAYYEFFVNGVRYTGYGKIYGNPFNTQTITVLYDSRDPSNNCTQFGKRRDNGVKFSIVLGIVFVVITFIVQLLF